MRFSRKIKNSLKKLIGDSKYEYLYLSDLYFKAKIKEKKDRQPFELLELKDKYLNHRCFIIATGPSLSLQDIELLKNEYTFSFNSIIKCFNRTAWRPNFYTITDPDAYDNFQKEINHDDFEKIFLPDDFKCSDEKVVFYRRAFSQHYDSMRKNKIKGIIYPSKNPEKHFVDAPSVVFIAIQIATYMGFRKIYLLGQDCDYSQQIQHSKVVDFKNKYKIPVEHGDNFIRCFENYKEFYDNKNVEIFNCTRGGRLEVLKRKKLEDVLHITNCKP